MGPSLPPIPLYQKLISTFWPIVVTGTRLLTPRLDLDTHDPILVLGNQKTGSTAIAQLLAHLGDLQVTTDIHPLQSPDAQLKNDPASIASLVQRLRYYFRRDVIKENELTVATDALLDILPQARPVFVIRHPVHNIRSILDRLDLPGRPLPLNELCLSKGGWQPILHGRDVGIQAENQITSLAKRWTYMTSIYQRHQRRLHLMRYEDFMKDKLGAIHNLASQLGVERKKNIRPFLDISFQPRGDHRSTEPSDFFTPHALDIINQQCTDGMNALNYEPIPASSPS